MTTTDATEPVTTASLPVTPPPSTPAPRRGRAPRPPGGRRYGTGLYRARLRILGWFVGLLAGTIVVGLLLQRTVLLNRIDDEIEASLIQEQRELQRLNSGDDPETGLPFASVDRLFEIALRRNVPLDGEALYTFVQGRPFGALPASDPGGLFADDAFLDQVRDTSVPVQGKVRSREGTVEFLAVPVVANGAPPGSEPFGVFVSAVYTGEERAEVERTAQLAALVALSSLLVASAVAWVIAGRVLRPVREVTDTARSITETDLRRRIPVGGQDEVGELATTFNQMLDRIEKAFTTQRQFVDDAGHELRTPITVVQGHLDLLGDDPTERRETVEMVQDELDRMARIVNDMLLLAKAEQPDFLRPGPVDLGELIEDVRARAVALDDRPWNAVVPPGPVEIVADRARLLQALVNLVANAARHTPSGTPVTVGAAVDQASEVVLWVRDEGPGIAPADHGRIFERFARAGTGPRPAGGAGLGLAIVSAIAEAHGGRVALASVPGGGATFSLHLPSTASGDGDRRPAEAR
ncbi:MAG: HAMP domain-containing histidine kinase [Acidimicrobiia bacterium]|nr:HAMP domain-containing histidine kinase [Acidimicrobiia bacterium]